MASHPSRRLRGLIHLAVSGWFWEQPDSGSGQYTRWLVQGLLELKADLQISVVVPDDKGQAAGRRGQGAALLPLVSCLVYPVPCSRSNFGKVWFEQVIFPRICHRLDVDVAHVPYWAPPLRPSVPTVVTIHDVIPALLPAYRGGLAVRAYTALVSQAARQAAAVLTDSEASRTDILAHLRLPPEQVRTVYLAVDTTPSAYWPAPHPGDEAVRASYGLPPAYVFSMPGFDVRKNVVTALRAQQQVCKALGNHYPLIVAGRLPVQDTPFTPDPRRMAAELGLGGEAVRFIGPVDEAHKPALYRGALASIYPSRYEGFGLPALESLACGTPVVACAVSSIPEVVGDAGVLRDPDDSAGMARALVRMASDAAFRAELSRRAVIQAGRFSWERCAGESLAAYSAACQR